MTTVRTIEMWSETGWGSHSHRVYLQADRHIVSSGNFRVFDRQQKDTGFKVLPLKSCFRAVVSLRNKIMFKNF